MEIWKRIKQVMMDAEAFADSKSDSIVDNILLVAASSTVMALVSVAEVFTLGRPSFTGLPFSKLIDLLGSQPLAAAAAFIGVVIGSVSLLLAGSLLLHLFALLLGAKKGFRETVPAMVVFLVPNLVLGWIPFVNIWTSIYTFLVIVYVLAKKQKLTMAKATLAIAMPIIIATIIVAFTSSASKAGLVQSLVPVNFG